MTPHEYQLETRRTRPAGEPRERALAHYALGLCEEAGELAGVIKKHVFYGHALDLDKLFIRVNARPRRDLARGYSYTMGCFGDESEAHAGLSGYSLGFRGVRGAVEALDDRMGVKGAFTADGKLRKYRAEAVMFVTVFRGRFVGEGPDGEELFEPSAIVASWKTREIASVEDLVERLAALGIRDED